MSNFTSGGNSRWTNAFTVRNTTSAWGSHFTTSAWGSPSKSIPKIFYEIGERIIHDLKSNEIQINLQQTLLNLPDNGQEIYEKYIEPITRNIHIDWRDLYFSRIYLLNSLKDLSTNEFGALVDFLSEKTDLLESPLIIPEFNSNSTKSKDKEFWYYNRNYIQQFNNPQVIKEFYYLFNF